VQPRTYFRLTPREYPAAVSIVIPVYNEAEVLPLLRDRLGFSDGAMQFASAKSTVASPDRVAA